MIKKLFLKYKELISYVFFGVLATIVSILSFKLFDVLLGPELYLLSNVISWIITVIFAYFTNKIWVFESKSWKANVLVKEIVSFFGARVFSLVVEEAGLWLMIDQMDMGGISWDILTFSISGNMIAKIIMQVVVVILNYVFSKLIIFKKKKRNKPAKALLCPGWCRPVRHRGQRPALQRSAASEQGNLSPGASAFSGGKHKTVKA